MNGKLYLNRIQNNFRKVQFFADLPVSVFLDIIWFVPVQIPPDAKYILQYSVVEEELFLLLKHTLYTCYICLFQFEIFIEFLRKDSHKVNAIQSIQNACTYTNIGMMIDYKVEELPQMYNR